MRINNFFDLGEAIRSYRMKKGLNQEQLASMIGATQEWVSRLENGRLSNPGMLNVMQAMNAVDLPLHVGGEAIKPTADNDLEDEYIDLADDLPSFMKP